MAPKGTSAAVLDKGLERLARSLGVWSEATEYLPGGDEGSRRGAEQDSVAPPRPLGRPGTEPALHRIHREVPSQLEQVPRALDKHCVESSLEKVSIEAVLSIESLCVRAVQVLHSLG
jgi:hypothetical protein